MMKRSMFIPMIVAASLLSGAAAYASPHDSANASISERRIEQFPAPNSQRNSLRDTQRRPAYNSRNTGLGQLLQSVTSSQSLVRSGGIIPLQYAAVSVSASKAKSIALRSVPGSEYLDMKLVGGNTYHVRVMKSGRRIDVYVDANTGRVK